MPAPQAGGSWGRAPHSSSREDRSSHSVSPQAQPRVWYTGDSRGLLTAQGLLSEMPDTKAKLWKLPEMKH